MAAQQQDPDTISRIPSPTQPLQPLTKVEHMVKQLETIENKLRLETRRAERWKVRSMRLMAGVKILLAEREAHVAELHSYRDQLKRAEWQSDESSGAAVDAGPKRSKSLTDMLLHSSEHWSAERMFQPIIRPRHDPDDAIGFSEMTKDINCKILPATMSNPEVWEMLRPRLLSDTPRSILFAYGPSGSGKSYTLYTQKDSMIPSTLKWLLNETAESQDISVTVSAGQEVMNKAYDILHRSKSGTGAQSATGYGRLIGKTRALRKLTRVPLTSVDQLHMVLQEIHDQRFVLSTPGNAASSRGHLVFSLFLEKNGRVAKEVTFVDLCGTEDTPDIDISKPRNIHSQAKFQTPEINQTLYSVRELLNCLNSNELRKARDFDERFSGRNLMSSLLRDRLYDEDECLAQVAGWVLICLAPGSTEDGHPHFKSSLDFARRMCLQNAE